MNDYSPLPDIRPRNDDWLAFSRALTTQVMESASLVEALRRGLAFFTERFDRPEGLILADPNLPGAHRLRVESLSYPSSGLSRLVEESILSLPARPPDVLHPDGIAAVCAVAVTPCRLAVGLAGSPLPARRLALLQKTFELFAQSVVLAFFHGAGRFHFRHETSFAPPAVTSGFTHEIDEFLRQALANLTAQFAGSRVSLVTLVDPTASEAVRKTPRMDAGWHSTERFQLDDGPLLRCLRGVPFLSQDAREALLPLQSGGEILGAVQVRPPEGQTLNESEYRLLLAIASSLAYATLSGRMAAEYRAASASLAVSRWELLNSRNTLRTLFDHLPTSLYIVDRSYNLAAVNRSRSERAGREPRLLVGRSCYEALHGRAQPCEACRVRDTLETGATTHRKALSQATGDQAQVWEISTYPIFSGDVRSSQVIVVEEDVTEKSRLEANLIQSEKLAAVGQLAASVAHEINNPLAAIIANAQLIRQDTQDENLLETARIIELAGSRASRTVLNLLDFARMDAYHPVEVDLNENVLKALSLLQHEVHKRQAALILNLGKNLPCIRASQDHLMGVWTNLVFNALDAVEGQPGEVRVSTACEGGALVVRVADNGKGIPADRLPRIFEPFYTTKGVGRGTGLGLSVCQRVVRQHGGSIEVISTEGAGSTFTVRLPLTLS